MPARGWPSARAALLPCGGGVPVRLCPLHAAWAGRSFSVSFQRAAQALPLAVGVRGTNAHAGRVTYPALEASACHPFRPLPHTSPAPHLLYPYVVPNLQETSRVQHAHKRGASIPFVRRKDRDVGDI